MVWTLYATGKGLGQVQNVAATILQESEERLAVVYAAPYMWPLCWAVVGHRFCLILSNHLYS